MLYWEVPKEEAGSLKNPQKHLDNKKSWPLKMHQTQHLNLITSQDTLLYPFISDPSFLPLPDPRGDKNNCSGMGKEVDQG